MNFNYQQNLKIVTSISRNKDLKIILPSLNLLKLLTKSNKKLNSKQPKRVKLNLKNLLPLSKLNLSINKFLNQNLS